MIGNTPGLLGPLIAALTLLGALSVTYVLLGPRRTPTTYELLTSARAQLHAGTTARSETAWTRVYKALYRRKIDAGFTRLPITYLALLFCGAALIGAGAGQVLYDAAVFALFGAVVGVYLLWLYLGWRAEELNKKKRAQIVEFITGMATAVAGGASEREAFAEQVEQLREAPLAFHLSRAQLEIDPRQGLGGRGFITVLASLDSALHDPLFHTFYTTVATSYSRSISLAEPLQRNATMARHIDALQIETHADFTQTRLTALIGYSIPFVLTFILHALEPHSVEAFYDTPIGLVAGLILVVWCRFFYWLVLRGERIVIAEARGAR